MQERSADVNNSKMTHIVMSRITHCERHKFKSGIEYLIRTDNIIFCASLTLYSNLATNI